jgi:hypothetical protein
VLLVLAAACKHFGYAAAAAAPDAAFADASASCVCGWNWCSAEGTKLCLQGPLLVLCRAAF